MNQDPNNLNQNNFNTQGNNEIPNSQPLQNSQDFNQQPIIQDPTSQSINSFENDNTNQSINSKPPKKMNLGLIIGIVVAVAIIGVIAFLILNKNNDERESSYQSNNNSSNGVYVSNMLEIHKASRDFIGKIDDMLMFDHKLYVLSENKVYDASLNNYAEITKVDNNVNEILQIHDYSALTKSDDNSYLFCSNGTCYKFNENNLFYSMLGSNLMNITFINSKLYLNSYDHMNNMNKTQDNINILIKKGEGNTAQFYDNIKDIYCFGSRDFYVLLNDNKLYDTYGDGTFSGAFLVGKYENPTTLSISQYPKLENVQKVYGNSDYFGRPLYSIVGDSKSLYTYSKSVMNDIELPSIDKQIKITLPSNYNLNNIKNVIFNKGILIVFNDGNIYIADKNDISNLRIDEELSKLNKENKILKIGYDQNYVFLMDDNTLYELK